MLVLRKEMKVGLGVAAAALGIALVYGIMATLSANSKTPGQANTDTSVASNDGGGSDSPTPQGVGGLPPVDEPKTPAKTADQYTESARTDGNKSDPWTQALQTGKVAMEVQPVSNHGSSNPPVNTFSTSGISGGGSETVTGPIVTQLPVGPSNGGETTSHSGGPEIVTPVNPPSGETTATAASGSYKVEPGDTFSKIAGKLFGDKRMASAIQQANPDIAPTRLRAGATIKVPAKDEVATIRGEVAKSKPRVTGAVNADKEYRVAAGDTLNRIAVKLYGHRAMWQDIYDANKTDIGSDPAKIKVGEVLKLPKPPTVTTAIAR